MEKRALLALALSFLVFVVFGYLQQKLYPPPPTPPAKTAPAPPAPVPAPPLPATAAASALEGPPPGHQPREVTVETPLYQAVFTEQGAKLKSFRLKKYWDRLPFEKVASLDLWLFSIDIERYQRLHDQVALPKELVQFSDPAHLPLAVTLATSGQSLSGEEIFRADRLQLLVKEGEHRLDFTWQRPDGLAVVKSYIFRPDSYRIDLVTTIRNLSPQPLQGQLSLKLSERGGKSADSSFTGIIWASKKGSETVASGSLKQPRTIPAVEWTALEKGYFLIAAVPQSKVPVQAVLEETPDKVLSATLKTEIEQLTSGQEASQSYILYLGPKDLDILKSLGLGLEQTVDFGWFHFLALPLLYVLKFFYKYLGNYGWAIVALTVLIRILFLYPNHKSFKSMQAMQKLQPKIAKLREKYKDDREALNRELMALYRTYKVNPLGGCLPMLLQLPVFIALYNILGYAIELRHAPFISTLPFTDIVWLADLSAKDPLLITPLIMGATMFIQQKMTPSPGDPAQAKLMLAMPVIFTFMFLNFASGLVLYWLLNNVLSIIQQYYTNKYLA